MKYEFKEEVNNVQCPIVEKESIHDFLKDDVEYQKAMELGCPWQTSS